MHIYSNNVADAEKYVAEGIQSRIEMPEMPVADPWSSIQRVLEAEDRIRAREEIDANRFGSRPVLG